MPPERRSPEVHASLIFGLPATSPIVSPKVVANTQQVASRVAEDEERKREKYIHNAH